MPRDSGFPSTPRGSQDERRARRRLLRELNDLDLSLAEPLLDLEEDDIADPAELSVEEAHDQLAAAEFSEAYRDLFHQYQALLAQRPHVPGLQVQVQYQDLLKNYQLLHGQLIDLRNSEGKLRIELRDCHDELSLLYALKMANESKMKVPYQYYSGEAIGTKYNTPEGEKVETFDSETYAEFVTRTMGPNNTDDVTTAQLVSFYFPIGAYSHNWYENNKHEPWMAAWSTMKPKFIAEFKKFTSVTETTRHFNEMKQGQTEEVSAFWTKVQVHHKKILEPLQEAMKNDAYWQTVTALPDTDASKIVYNRLYEVITKHYERAFVLINIKAHHLKFITQRGKTVLEDIINEAKQNEDAIKQQNAQRGMAALEDLPLSREEIDALRAIRNKRGSGNRGNSSNGGGKPQQSTAGNSDAPSGQGSGGARPKPRGLKCYYCLEAGHAANRCDLRANDRAADKWRHTVRDAPLPKARYDLLPKPWITNQQQVNDVHHPQGVPQGQQQPQAGHHQPQAPQHQPAPPPPQHHHQGGGQVNTVSEEMAWNSYTSN